MAYINGQCYLKNIYTDKIVLLSSINNKKHLILRSALSFLFGQVLSINPCLNTSYFKLGNQTQIESQTHDKTYPACPRLTLIIFCEVCAEHVQRVTNYTVLYVKLKKTASEFV